MRDDEVAFAGAADEVGHVDVPERDVLNTSVGRQLGCTSDGAFRNVYSDKLAFGKIDGHPDEVNAFATANFQHT